MSNFDVSIAHGQSATWTTTVGAGDGLWSSAGNWIGGVPTSGTTTSLTFGATSGTTLLNQNLGSPFILNSMTFIRGTGGQYTLTGGDLQFSGTNANITFTGTGISGIQTQTIANNLIIGGNSLLLAVNGTNNNVVRIRGNITNDLVFSSVLTLSGTSTGTNTILGNILDSVTGTISLVKDGASTWALTGSNSFSGNISLYGGTLQFNNANALGLGSAITTGSGAVTTTLQFTGTGGAITLSRTLNLSGTNSGLILSNVGTGTSTITIQGTIAPTSGTGTMKTLTLTGTNTGISELQSTIGSVSSSNIALFKGGTGGWNLSAANNFAGNISIAGGTLYYNSVSNDGATASALGLGNTVFLVGTPTGGALSLSSAVSQTFSRQLYFVNSGTISNTSAAPTTTLLVNGNVTVVGGSHTLNLGGANTGVNVFASTLTNGIGSVSLGKIDAGTWKLTGANTFTGGTTLSAGTLIVGHDNALGTGTLTLAGGTFISDASRTFANPLSLSGGITFSNDAGTTITFDSTGVINSNVSTTLTNLSVDGAASIVLKDDIVLGVGNSGLTFAGTSAITLSGNISLSGFRTIAAVNVGGQSLNSIALSVAGAPSGTLNLTGTTPLTVNGVISDGPTSGGQVRITNTVILNSANTYSGGTTLFTGAMLTINDIGALGTGPLASFGGIFLTNVSGTLSNNLNLSSITFTGSSQSLTFDGPGINQASSSSSTFTNNLGGMLRLNDELRIVANTLTFTGNSPVLLDGGVSLTGSAGISLTFANTGGGILNNGINLSADGAAHVLALRTIGSSSLVVNGPITDGATGGGLTLTGLIAINGTNSYLGGTSISGGVITVGNAAAFGTGPITFTAGTLQAGVAAVTLANDINLVGTLTLSGSQMLTLSGTITASTTRSIIAGGSGGTVLNNINLNGSATSFALTLGGGGPLTVAGTIAQLSATNVSLNISNTGGVTLAGASTYGGVTSLAGGSLLILGADSTATSGPLGIGKLVVSGSGAILAADSSPRSFSNDVQLNADVIFSGTQALIAGGTFTNTTTTSRIFTANNSGGTTLGSIVMQGSLANTSLLIFGGNSSLTVGPISVGTATVGSVNITNSSSGGVTFVGDNTYTGATAVGGSTLYLGSGGTAGNLSGDLSLTGGKVVFNHSNIIVFGQAGSATSNIAGSGSIEINGPSTGGVQFNSANTFVGPTTVTQGTLRYGIVNALPVLTALTINTGGTVDLNGFNAALTTLSDGLLGGGAILNSSTTAAALTLTQGVFSGRIGGPLSLLKTSTGSLTLAGPNVFSGSSTLAGGTLVVGHNSALGTVSWTVNGTATLQGDGTARTIANNFTLSGSLTVAGSSYLEIDGSITNAIANRTLTISNSGGTVFGDINISSTTTARTLTLFVAGPTTVAGTVANSLTPTGASASGLVVSLTGNSTLTFGGALNYTSGTTINGGGTVVLAAGSTVTNHAITVSGGSTLRLNAGAIVNNASAAFSVTSGGSLVVNGTTGAGAINVQNGSFLSGSGVIGGTVSLTNGSLSPGDGGIGTLSMKRLILNGGTLNFELDSILASDRILLTGTAAPTVNAATVFNFSNLLGFGTGTYRLISGYTGTLSTTNFNLLSSPTLLGGYNLSLRNMTGELDLVVSDSSSTNLTWVGNVGGNWDTTSANWAGGTGVFANGVYNVSFDNTSTTQQLAVAAGGVVPTAMTVDNDSSHNYLFTGGPITSTGSLTKLGDGTLTFANSVTFTAGAIVSAGTLQIGAGDVNGSFRGNLVDNSVVSFNRAGVYTFSNTISGTGSVSFDGPGTLTLSSTNSYAGYTTLANGQLKLANNAALGASTLVAAGGTIIPDAAARTIANNIALNSDLTLTGNGGSLTLSGVINGPGGLIVGSGSLYQIFGANTFSGASTLAPGGSINLGSNAALGSSALNVNGGIVQSNSSTRTVTNSIVLRGDLTTSGLGFTVNGAGILNAGGSHTLTVNSSTTLTVANLVLADQPTPLGLVIAGSGGATFGNLTATGGAISSTVWITNTSTTGILFTGNNTYTGVTTVGPGSTLRLGNLSTSGNLAGDVANLGTLVFRRSNAFTYTGSISGNGSVVINGTGAATFAGNHSYTGVTSVNGGTLNVTGTLGNTAVTVAAGAALGGNGRIGGSVDILAGGNLIGPLTIDGVLTSSGWVGPGSGTVGTLSLGALVLNGGTLNFDLAGIGASDQIVLAGGIAPTVNAATNLSFTNFAGFGLGTYALLTGYTGQLSATGFGLLSAPSILGGYNISLANNAGELDLIVSSVAAGNVAWTGAIDNVWNTTTANWTGDASTFTDVFTNVTFSTNTSVTNVLVDAAGVQPNNMTVTTDATHNYLFSGGTITSSGALTKSGTGSLTFANDVAFTGGTTIFAGTLQIGTGGTNGSLAGDVVNRGQLLFNRTDTQTFNGNLSGTGGVTVTGGGTVLFTGNAAIFSGTTTVANGTLVVQAANYGTTAGTIYVGRTSDSGSLVVNSGSQLTSLVGYIGYTNSSTGFAMVTGVGSQWIMSSSLHVGYTGNGNMTVQNGGLVQAGGTYLGFGVGSVGTLTIDGVNSRWTNTGALSANIGYWGNGTLRVQNGGTALANIVYLGFNTPGTGTFTVDGAGSTLSSTGTIYAGYTGMGSVVIQNGGGITSSSGNLGFSAGSIGTAVVDGVGSQWLMSSNLNIGYSGAGSLTVQNGGSVQSVFGFVGFTDVSTGSAIVDGTGSQWLMSSSLYIGNSGSGTLTVQNGGSVQNSIGYIGNSVGSSGTAVVDGVGSQWTMSSSLNVGNSGQGSLTIQNGGTVQDSSAFVGNNAGSTGTATVTGLGSQWLSSSNLNIGYTGAGSLTVQNGATVQAFAGRLGYNPGSSGTAVIDGTGTLFSTTSDITFGFLGGTGSMTVQNGATVQSLVGHIGYATGGTGSAVVNGVGSQWLMSSALNVGYSGNGSLTVQNGGVVTASIGSISASPGSTGVASVIGPSSRLSVTNSFYIGGSASGVGGNGSLTLSGGGSAVVGGTTRLFSAGSLTINPGSTLTTRSLVLSGGTLNFGLGSILPTGAIILTGTAAPNVTASTALSFTNFTGFGAGTYHLISGYAGALSSTSFGLLSSPVTLDGYLLSLQNNSGMLDLLVATTTGTNLIWTGASNNVWNDTSVNWTGSGITFSNGISDVTFGNGSAVTTITVDASGVQPQQMTVDNDGAHNFLFSGGAISSSSALTKLGVGTLTFANDTAFAGGATISGGTLQIGNGGASGSLTGDIINNAQLTFNRTGSLTYGGSISGSGNVTFTGGGTTVLTGTSTYTGVTAISNGLLVIQGGKLGSTAGDLNIGSTSSGAVTVTAGGTLLSSTANFGRNLGSTGTATISGSGSRWIVAYHAIVGQSGRGSLAVQNGGSLTTNVFTLGANVGSTGTAVVDGVGSSLSTTGNLFAGNLGAGLLTIQNGGTVSSATGILGFGNTGRGTVTVDGSGSQWNLSGYLHAGYSNTAGLAALNIQNGGAVSSLVGYVGYNSGSVGSVTVSGGGSVWTTTNFLNIGERGRGTVDVRDGGAADTNSAWLGVIAGGTGTGTVSGSGSQWTMSGAGGLIVGYSGTGTFNVLSGGRAVASSADAGFTGTSNGAITVDGAGSVLSVTNSVRIGYSSQGVMNVRNGGRVDSTWGELGYNQPTASGTVSISGTGSQWNVSQDLQIGGNNLTANGNGVLTITAGGAVNVGDLTRVWGPGSVVLGPGSTLTTASLILSGGTLNFGLSSTSGSGLIAISGASAPNVTALSNLTFSNYSGFGAGSYRLITGYSGNLSTTAFNFLSTPTTLGGYYLSLANNIGGLDLLVSTFTNANYLTWTGAAGESWDTTTANWTGSSTVFTDGSSNVRFDDTAVLRDINVATTTVQPLEMSVDNDATHNFKFVGGAIDSVGMLTKTGNGSLTFATNGVRFAGGIAVQSGTLQIGTGFIVGPLSGNIANNGLVQFNIQNNLTYSDVVSGTGSLGKYGVGTLILAGNNTFTGVTTVGYGGLEIRGSYLSNIRDDASVIFNSPTTQTYAGTITGTGDLRQNGGTLAFTGDHTYQGTTYVSPGSTLQLGVGGTSGSVSSTGIIDVAGTLVFNRSDVVSRAGRIGGTGGVVQAGSGTLIFTTTNDYTGGTTISAGTLQIGNGGATGSLLGNIVNNGQLTFNRTGTSTYVGGINGTGSVTFTGGGTAILTGFNNYSGNTTIIGSSLIVQGGSLGTTSGNFFVGSTAGNGALTITAGATLLSATGFISNAVNGSANVVVDGPGSKWITDEWIWVGYSGTGSITVQNGGEIRSSAIFTSGNAGSVTISGAGSMWTATGNVDVGYSGPVNGTGSLLISNGGVLNSGAGFVGLSIHSATATINGAGSTWNASSPVIVGLSPDGAGTLTVTNGGTANFYGVTLGYYAGAVGMATVSGSGSQLNLSNNLIVGNSGLGTLTIINGARVSAGNSYLGYDPGSVGTATVSGTGSQWNSNSLTLGGSTLTSGGNGAMTVTGGGSLQVVGTTTLYGTGSLTVGAGGLFASRLLYGTGNIQNDGSVVLGGTNGSSTFSGMISGGGSLVKTGTGTIIFTGANTYSGGTTISGGTLQLGNGGTAGAIAGNIVNNALLQINRSGSLTIGGIIGGTGSVSLAGGGTVVFTGNNAYTGTTTVGFGNTLQLGNGGASGSIVGNINNAGTVVFNRSNAFTYSGTISSTGGVRIDAGDITFTTPQAYTGGTTIAGGAVLTLSGFNASLTGNIVDNGSLVFNRTTTYTFGNVVSGTGGVNVAGGTVIVTGANTYSGGTTISGGTLQLGVGGATGSVVGNIVDNGFLALNRTGTYTYGGQISGSGSVALYLGSVTFTNAQTYSGRTTIASGSSLTLAGPSASITGDVANFGSLTFSNSQTYAGSISGTGNVTITGGNTLIYTGNSSNFGGTTMIGNGTLVVQGGNYGNTTSTLLVGHTSSAGSSITITAGGTASAHSWEALAGWRIFD